MIATPASLFRYTRRRMVAVVIVDVDVVIAVVSRHVHACGSTVLSEAGSGLCICQLLVGYVIVLM